MQREKQGKYIWVIDYGHPMAGSRGRVLEHRYVMAAHLGRSLTGSEVVHHKDRDTTNNELDNLELMSRGDHTRPRELVPLLCRVCGAQFRRKKHGKGFCSISCGVKHQHVATPQTRCLPHGSYGNYRKGCRCQPCKDANSKRIREARHQANNSA